MGVQRVGVYSYDCACRHFIRYTLLVVVLPPDMLKLFMAPVQQGAGNSPFWFTLT